MTIKQSNFFGKGKTFIKCLHITSSKKGIGTGGSQQMPTATFTFSSIRNLKHGVAWYSLLLCVNFNSNHRLIVKESQILLSLDIYIDIFITEIFIKAEICFVSMFLFIVQIVEKNPWRI